jgi:hypothetical protein
VWWGKKTQPFGVAENILGDAGWIWSWWVIWFHLMVYFYIRFKPGMKPMYTALHPRLREVTVLRSFV